MSPRWRTATRASRARCSPGRTGSRCTPPAGYPVRDFLGWATEHHHCPALLVPALRTTTGAATDADTRWTLIARLLHDNTLELTDRVAGAFPLCYGQQLSRIAVPKVRNNRPADHQLKAIRQHRNTAGY
jgi:hypothetical protein